MPVHDEGVSQALPSKGSHKSMEHAARLPQRAAHWPQQKRFCHPATMIESLDDACLVRILAFLTPMPDRFNAGRVCKRWAQLAGDRRLWLRVEGRDTESRLPPGASFDSLAEAVTAARPGDTILIAAGQPYSAQGIKIMKPLCLLGGGKTQDETILVSPRGFEGALEFHANARVANLTVIAQLGSCLLHRRGRLVVENCVLECAEHPLEHLVCPIVSTAPGKGGGGGGWSQDRKENVCGCSQSGPASPLRGGRLAHLPDGGAQELACCIHGRELTQDEGAGASGEGSQDRSLDRSVLAVGPAPCCPLTQQGGGSSGCAAGFLQPCGKGGPAPPAACAGGGAQASPCPGDLPPGAVASTSDGVDVVETRIGGGLGAVRISGGLALQQVRVMYARAALVFWFTLAQQQPQPASHVPKGAVGLVAS